MCEEKPAWVKSMADPPFASRQFTADLKYKVLQRAGESKRNLYSILPAITVPIVIASLVIGWPQLKDEVLPLKLESKDEISGKLTVRNTYYDPSGRQLFTVYPEPYAEAGKSSGYMFHFDEPMETYLGKMLTFQAVHPQSGIKMTLSSEVITKPSPGYTGLERYTTRFVLPLAGMWELTVLLDDKPYGIVQLLMLEPSWDITPEFQSGTYLMRGVEKKLGIIDAGFMAGKTQKYMWHFWGNDNLLNGPFEVKAIKKGTNKLVDVYSSNQLSSANALAGELNGADRHIVTMMSLPEAGRWRLLPYVRGRLLDTIVVDVSK
ncbi:DUF4871 domain-containing protein [Paenibacillus thalictri]|uniref:DUF4871 domain-containing protein n=1 Tax=Paenibacillus thalictri TaxID=2527873 RepID=A0A4Q9DU70_9BACL|nr:DUF4871 domain-containing protein [Paenibacillus thalictri]TBL79093.1 DUF4871 domain-containing protein [Paenibacillus thalictri]